MNARCLVLTHGNIVDMMRNLITLHEEIQPSGHSSEASVSLVSAGRERALLKQVDSLSAIGHVRERSPEWFVGRHGRRVCCYHLMQANIPCAL